MSRSVRKGPYVDVKLLKKVRKAKDESTGRKIVIQTWARNSDVTPEFVGVTLAVHNGKAHVPVLITEDMIGHKLGEFAVTRTYYGHEADKKSKK